jgi:rare lipoprotein A
LDGVTSHGSEPDSGRDPPLSGLVFDARLWFVVLLLSVASLWVWPGGSPEDLEPAGLGERLVPIGQPAPKGGGHFKIGQPYEINGVQFTPKEDSAYVREGVASWYGALFHGRRTSNGEIFDMERLSAAHPTLPLPVYVEVTNLDNGRSAMVRVNDRGPFRKKRLIDLSERTAEVLGFKRAGTAKVRVRFLRNAGLDGDDTFERDYLSTRGYSEYARTTDPDGGPEVEIAVGAPAPPAPPSLPDRPDRAAVAALPSTSEPTVIRGSETGRDGDTAVVGLEEGAGAVETTGSIRPAVLVPRGPMIQAGFFKNQANAWRARSALSGVGPVEVAPVVDHGETYYRVRVGPFADGISAAAALSDVADAGYRGAKIVLKN